jgi:hypothetical protein
LRSAASRFAALAFVAPGSTALGFAGLEGMLEGARKGVSL